MKNSYTFLEPYMNRKKYLLILAMLFSLIATIAGLLPWLSLYEYIKAGVENTFTAETVNTICAALAIAALLAFAAKSMATSCSHKVAYEVMANIRKKVINHTAKVSMGFFSGTTSGSIKKVLTEDTTHIETFIAHHLPDLFSSVFSILLILLYMFWSNWVLALVALLPLLLVPWLQKSMARGASERMTKWMSVVSRLNSSVVEYIKAIIIVKVFDLKLDSAERYSKVIDEYCEVWTEITKTQGPPFALFTVLTQSPIVLIMPAGGILFLAGYINGISYLLFCILSCVYLSSLKSLAFLSTDLAYLTTGAGKINEILEIPEIPEAEKSQAPSRYDIEFDGVCFGYSNNDILHNVSFQLSQGSTMALVGTSGAGKSTIAKLLLRFWDVSKGSIKIGNVDIRSISFSELMCITSYVSQDVFIQDGTVFDNIKMGRKAASKDAVYKAARKAQIHDFITTLPDGYNTVIGRNGLHLSGGEKQRISIARACLKNAPILILDEAMSYADVENEMLLQLALQELSRDKTVISIAHRLGNLKNAEKILYLDAGRVDAYGGFHEVVAKSNGFKNTWERYEEANSLLRREAE